MSEWKNREEFFLSAIYGKVLDIGCIQGELHNILSRKKGIELFGIDPTDINYSDGEKKSFENFKFGIMESIPFPNNCFDCVVAGEVLEHTLVPIKAIKECKRVLKTGGLLLLSTPNKKSWLNLLFKAYEGKGSPEWPHRKIFTTKELTQELEKQRFVCQEVFLKPYNNISAEFTRYRFPGYYLLRELIDCILPEQYKEQIIIKAEAK